MTVYVDDSRIRYRGMIMCHMVADTDAELRAMAAAIGVEERHHQGDHFDICQRKRAHAVQLGAKQITRREAVVIRNRFPGVRRYA
jgi:hypothetical protein